MCNKNREVSVGSQWIHFKQTHLAKIMAVATHTETNEKLVVYECYEISNDKLTGIFARPLNMFLSTVDMDKYPNAEQKYRFRKIKN